MNLSFAGCGFLGIYHIGVVSCFREYYPNLVYQLSGASAGAMAACCYICNCNLGQITSDTLKVAISARRLAFGPFNPKFDVTGLMQERMEVILPDNAHILCSGRLRISVTRVSDGKNVILDQFNSKQEVIQALQCSSFIPLVAGIIPPTFRGIRYIDGCYSDNLPVYDRNTVTVSPFCGRSDICPRDNSFNLLEMNVANTSIDLSTQNIYRFVRILFPPHPEILSQMCKQGFEDALRFLQKNDLISCARCIAINSTLRLRATNGTSVGHVTDDDGLSDDEDNCTECKRQQQRAHLDDLPEAVLTVFEEACASVNNGLINWIFKHKTMRILSMLTLPYVLPMDIAYVVLSRFMELTPKLGLDVSKILESLVEYARSILGHFNKNRHVYSAKFTCQLAITEYDYDADDGYIARPFLRKIPPQSCRRHSNIASSSDETSPTTTTTRGTSQQLDSSRVLGTVNFDFKVNLQSACLTDLPSSFDEMGQPSSSTSGFRPLMTAHGADWKEETVIDIANAALHWDSRKTEICDSQEDTFEKILKVTRQQDALMAFYYLDERNRLKVTEIFNVTDADTSFILRADERETNRLLAWEEERWSELPRGGMRKAAAASVSDSSLDCTVDTSDEIFNSSILEDVNDGLTETQIQSMIYRDF